MNKNKTKNNLSHYKFPIKISDKNIKQITRRWGRTNR